MGDFVMPSLGADMDAGTLVEWKVKPGDTVHRGDIVATVETQKGAIEVEIFEDGVIETLQVQKGSQVPVGTVLATLKSEKPEREKPVVAVPPRMRQAIAAAMTHSHKDIPPFFLSTRMDVSDSIAWLANYNSHKPPNERLLPILLFLKATALAVKEYPEFNGFFENGVFRPGAGIHLGIVTSIREGGVVVPALHEVDQKPLAQLTQEFQEVLLRARTSTLRSSDVSDATLTVTSLGERGVDAVYGIIFPPQVALVGFGRIHDEAWATEGVCVARPVVHATLVADHRVSDGHRGALFLSRIAEWLAQPEAL